MPDQTLKKSKRLILYVTEIAINKARNFYQSKKRSFPELYDEPCVLSIARCRCVLLCATNIV